MDFGQRSQEIIEGAERALAALAAEAASQRDYTAATLLLGQAQRIAATLRGPMDAKQVSLATPPPSARAPTATIGDPSVTHGNRPPSQYPRFKREDNTLIKVGWSKADKATYEHRSPRTVLDRLLARITEVGSSGHRFTTEQILPLLDDDAAELPSYQAYLCIAWLVDAGLLQRYGRQGYTIAVAGDLRPAVEAQWEQLGRR